MGSFSLQRLELVAQQQYHQWVTGLRLVGTAEGILTTTNDDWNFVKTSTTTMTTAVAAAAIVDAADAAVIRYHHRSQWNTLSSPRLGRRNCRDERRRSSVLLRNQYYWWLPFVLLLSSTSDDNRCSAGARPSTRLLLALRRRFYKNGIGPGVVRGTCTQQNQQISRMETSLSSSSSSSEKEEPKLLQQHLAVAAAEKKALPTTVSVLNNNNTPCRFTCNNEKEEDEHKDSTSLSSLTLLLLLFCAGRLWEVVIALVRRLRALSCLDSCLLLSFSRRKATPVAATVLTRRLMRSASSVLVVRSRRRNQVDGDTTCSQAPPKLSALTSSKCYCHPLIAVVQRRRRQKRRRVSTNRRMIASSSSWGGTLATIITMAFAVNGQMNGQFAPPAMPPTVAPNVGQFEQQQSSTSVLINPPPPSTTAPTPSVTTTTPTIAAATPTVPTQPLPTRKPVNAENVLVPVVPSTIVPNETPVPIAPITLAPTAPKTLAPTIPKTAAPTIPKTAAPTPRPPSASPSQQPTISQEPSSRPSPSPSASPSQQPTISSEPSNAPSNAPTPQPSAHPSSRPSFQPTSEVMEDSEEFNNRLTVNCSACLLSPSDIENMMLLYESYTPEFAPASVRVTSVCAQNPAIPQIIYDLGGSFALQFQFSCTYTSGITNVTANGGYTRMFQNYVNRNLVMVTEQIQDLNISIISALPISTFVVATPMPTTSMSPTVSPTNKPTISAHPSSTPTDAPTITMKPPSLVPTASPSANPSKRFPPWATVLITIMAGLGVLFVLFCAYRINAMARYRREQNRPNAKQKNKEKGRVPSAFTHSRYGGDLGDSDAGVAVVSPSESLVSMKSMLSAGDPSGGAGDDSADEADDTNFLQDEFDEYKDQNLEQLRSEVEGNLSGFEGLMSAAVTKSLMDEEEDMDPRELLWGCQGNPAGADVEASALYEVSSWLQRNQNASVEKKRRFVQQILNKMVASVRYGVIRADDASRTIHESALVLGLPLANDLPSQTVIVSGMRKTVTSKQLNESLSEFGQIEVAAVASCNRGFGIVRFRHPKSLDRAMRRYRHGEVVVQDVGVQMKVLSPSSNDEQVESPAKR